jgi:fucose permease
MFSKRNSEIVLIYLAGFGQGACFVTVPALGNILKSPGFHHFTSSEFGSLFLPMIVCAILASSLGGLLARRWGLKRVFLLGMFSYAASMSVLALSHLFVGSHGAAYALVLLAISGVGIGIGATLTALGAYAASFFARKSEAALTALYAIMGMGMAVTPLAVGVFVARDVWWGMPLLLTVYYLILVLLALAFPLSVAQQKAEAGEMSVSGLVQKLPGRFWGYAAVIFFYGVCETVFGNWTVIYLHEGKGVSQQWAGYALSAFWFMLMLGRIFSAVISLRFSVRGFFVGMPVLTVLVFLIIPLIGGNVGNVAVFALGGLACSVMLPLGISFAEQESPDISELVSGWMIAAVMLGIGFGSYGVGLLRDMGGVGFSTIYANSSLIAAVMAAVAFYLMRTRRAEVSVIA